MTDERMGDVEGAVRALPRGSGIVFRHHATPPAARRALFATVRAIARARRHVLVLAARPAVARSWGADGAHHRSGLASRGLRTVAVHSVPERILAQALRAELIFMSPVFATRSHPGARGLGRVRLGLLAGPMRRRAIALGGLDAERFRSLTGLGLYGWAAIDALSVRP